MSKFKVGDQIVGNAGADKYSITSTGTRWEVILVINPIRTRVCHPGSGDSFVVEAKYFDLVIPDLDPKKPMVFRSGAPVNAQLTGDPVRPYWAVVNGMTLTFDAQGRFYPGFEQPIDLVNI